MQEICRIFRIDFRKLLFAVNIALVHRIGVSPTQTAGRTVLTRALPA